MTNRHNQIRQDKEPNLSRRQALVGIFGAAVLAGCSREDVKKFVSRESVCEPEDIDESCSVDIGEHDPANSWRIDFTNMADGPLDSDQWNFETGSKVADYNGEQQTYTDRRRNVRIEDGALVIEAHQESIDDHEFSSGRIDTLDIANFRYGKIEFEAQLPRGAGTWPAAWLMPDKPRYDPDDFDVAEDDKWRWAMNGEIDVLEAIGTIENENIPGAHSIGQLRKETIYTPVDIDDAYGKFHKYGLIKKPDSLVFTLDGVPYAKRERQATDTPIDWPYNQSYYVILNLALGGPWAGAETDKYPPHGIDTDAHESWQYKIRSITCQAADVDKPASS